MVGTTANWRTSRNGPWSNPVGAICCLPTLMLLNEALALEYKTAGIIHASLETHAGVRSFSAGSMWCAYRVRCNYLPSRYKARCETRWYRERKMLCDVMWCYIPYLSFDLNLWRSVDPWVLVVSISHTSIVTHLNFDSSMLSTTMPWGAQ
jgi:hypothetical protein